MSALHKNLTITINKNNRREKMELQQFISPCHFGMEAILKREIYDLGYDIVKVEDGRVTYEEIGRASCRERV